jgi:hypothetical protein
LLQVRLFFPPTELRISSFLHSFQANCRTDVIRVCCTEFFSRGLDFLDFLGGSHQVPNLYSKL